MGWLGGVVACLTERPARSGTFDMAAVAAGLTERPARSGTFDMAAVAAGLTDAFAPPTVPASAKNVSVLMRRISGKLFRLCFIV